MFTTVHLHLLLNHLPIIVTALGLLLLALAARRHDDHFARVALAFLVGAAASTLPTYLTGEGAEDAVKQLPGVTRDLIEQHSEYALIASIAVGVLGAGALWALWRFRRPTPMPARVVGPMLAGALIASGLMAYVGLLGGQIRHTEVRSGFVPPAAAATVVPAGGRDTGGRDE